MIIADQPFLTPEITLFKQNCNLICRKACKKYKSFIALGIQNFENALKLNTRVLSRIFSRLYLAKNAKKRGKKTSCDISLKPPRKCMLFLSLVQQNAKVSEMFCEITLFYIYRHVIGMLEIKTIGVNKQYYLYFCISLV